MLDTLKEKLLDFNTYTDVLLALVTLVVGLWIIKWATKLIRKGLKAREFDKTLQSFLADLVNALLKIILFISIVNILGIPTTSFVAILGAAGLAVGFALQGSLSNFAGGVLLLIFRPFKVGDFIEAQGFVGFVRALNIMVTTIESPDSKTVIIPNGPLANGPITNLTTRGYVRVDLVVGIGYGENIKLARKVLMEVMEADDRILKDPAPSVNVLELADSSVNLAVRPYCSVDDYWGVYFSVYEKAKEGLDAAGIEIPFPQRVVTHINAPK